MKRVTLRNALLACLVWIASMWGGHGALHAADYAVDYTASTLRFSGAHAGNAFSGEFKEWQASIAFDSQNLPASQITVTVNTASAHTGNAMYDGALPTADWFAVKDHPQATFVSTRITHEADGAYQAEGTLTLRGVSQPVLLRFTLAPADAATPQVNAHITTTLDRLAYGMGKASDPTAEWVSREIGLEITLSAVRK